MVIFWFLFACLISGEQFRTGEMYAVEFFALTAVITTVGGLGSIVMEKCLLFYSPPKKVQLDHPYLSNKVLVMLNKLDKYLWNNAERTVVATLFFGCLLVVFS